MNENLPASQARVVSRPRAAYLAAALVVIAAVYSAPLSRRVQFLLTGSVRAEGGRLHLDPQDRLITGAILRDGTWEKPETETVRRLLRPGDTFVDVGANVGWYTAVASRAVGERGRVIAFEPAPDRFKYLSRTVAANGARNVKIEPRALSDRAGTLTCRIGATSEGRNSILASAATPESVKVPTVTLDDYLKGVPGEIRLIKIDTQGAEGFILGGMVETFRKNPDMAILMQYHPALIRAAGFSPATLIRQLYGLGYRVETIESGPTGNIPVGDDMLDRLTAALEERNSSVKLLATK